MRITGIQVGKLQVEIRRVKIAETQKFQAAAAVRHVCDQDGRAGMAWHVPTRDPGVRAESVSGHRGPAADRRTGLARLGVTGTAIVVGQVGLDCGLGLGRDCEPDSETGPDSESLPRDSLSPRTAAAGTEPGCTPSQLQRVAPSAMTQTRLPMSTRAFVTMTRSQGVRRSTR